MVVAINTSVKGRTRYKVKGLYRSERLKEYLAMRLSAHEAIYEITLSTLTGNALIRYNSGNTPRTIASILESILSEYRGRGGNCGFRIADCGMESLGLQCVHEDLPKSKVRKTDDGIKSKLRRFLPFGVEQQTEPWHLMESDAVLAAFGSSCASGLSSPAAGESLQKYGANLLPESASRSGLSMFIDQFKSLPVALLGVAAGISVVTGGIADAIVILGVVVINGIIGFVTESEAERTINSLKSLVRPCATVIRDCCVKEVSAEEIVPGDVLVLRPGSYIAADGRLVDASHLTVDESALTGESMPVVKTVFPITGKDVALADRVNMVYMGTMVTGGQGLAVVTATGRFTEIGQLQMLVGEAVSPETPMERQLNKLGDQLVLISGAACGLVFVLGMLRGYGLLQMLKTSISLAVAAVPEGLPTVATTTLALGIKNMKKHHVLIRQLAAVETLGCVQTICMDKTGTITQNKMAVLNIFTGLKCVKVRDGQLFEGSEPIVPETHDELLRLIQATVLCSETVVAREKEGYVLKGSPTENALVQLAINADIDVVRLREQYPLIKANYRSENRLFMGTIHESEDGGKLVAIKGSPMEVLALCDRHIENGELLPLTEDDQYQIELRNEQMAGEALRVLGVAYTLIEGEEAFEEEPRCIWLGLIGMADPIRPGVSSLIGQFHQAGVETVMITGDQSPTAFAIGKELDLGRGEQIKILDSNDLSGMNPEVVRALSQKVHVFARVSPAHKLQIVQALQSTGKVVAMTGDGINDGPALKAADIGIAMGKEGTDMAREVADVVLEEDNLETMIIAVRDGRTIYDNIRKSLHFLLATNFSEIMVMVLTVAAGVGSPLSAMQLLWINLISDIFPGLALAMEEAEPGVLHRPPRAADEPIINTSDFKRLSFEATTMSVGAMAPYAYGMMKYGGGAQASTMAFQGLSLTQLIHAFSCRSEKHTIFDKEGLPPNKYLNIAMGGSIAIQLLTMVIPGLRTLLGTAPLAISDGLVTGTCALLPFLVNEATKKNGGE